MLDTSLLSILEDEINKKFSDAVNENFAEANINDDGNLIITTKNSSLAFEISESGELIVNVENDINNIDEDELDEAIESAINEILGGES